MNDEKTKEIRSWARTIIEDRRKDSDFFDNGVVEAAEFILRETKPPLPEGDLLFRKAKHPDYGEVTVISSKVIEGVDNNGYLHTIRRDPETESGTVINFYEVDDLDFYPDGKSDIKTRRDFHTLKTGTVVKASKEGRPLVAVKASISSWEITGCTGCYSDQDMEDVDYEWEVI